MIKKKKHTLKKSEKINKNYHQPSGSLIRDLINGNALKNDYLIDKSVYNCIRKEMEHGKKIFF